LSSGVESGAGGNQSGTSVEKKSRDRRIATLEFYRLPIFPGDGHKKFHQLPNIDLGGLEKYFFAIK
jgi:hypothetical protein